MPMHNVDIQSYCSDDKSRALSSPFLVDEFAVATNGHIMIFLPAKNYPEVQGNSDAPVSSTRDFLKLFETESFKDISEPTFPEKVACENCKGTGQVMHPKCQECNGKGYIEFVNTYNSYEVECASCDSSGNGKMVYGLGSVCEDCEGTKVAFSPNDTYYGMEFMGGRISPNYLEKVLGDVTNAEACYMADKMLFLFRNEDIKALVMGMRQ